MAEHINEIMILNDGETFTGVIGCQRAKVLWDEDADGSLTEEEWDAKLADFAEKYPEQKLWDDLEYGIIALITEEY